MASSPLSTGMQEARTHLGGQVSRATASLTFSPVEGSVIVDRQIEGAAEDPPPCGADQGGHRPTGKTTAGCKLLAAVPQCLRLTDPAADGNGLAIVWAVMQNSIQGRALRPGDHRPAETSLSTP